MDPNVALAMLIDSILCDDYDSAQDCLDALRTWRKSDGFLPADPRVNR